MASYLARQFLRPSTASSSSSARLLSRSFRTTTALPKDPPHPYQGRVEHFTGGRQGDAAEGPRKPELDVGEMEGISFRVEPIRRVGEDAATMRARLLCLFSYSFHDEYHYICTHFANQW